MDIRYSLVVHLGFLFTCLPRILTGSYRNKRTSVHVGPCLLVAYSNINKVLQLDIGNSVYLYLANVFTVERALKERKASTFSLKYMNHTHLLYPHHRQQYHSTTTTTIIILITFTPSINNTTVIRSISFLYSCIHELH